MSYFDFGVLNIVVAMLVATVKATLVALFFMHLYEDQRVNQVVFISAFIFLALLILLIGSDLFFRPTPQSKYFHPEDVSKQFVEKKHSGNFEIPSQLLIEEGKNLFERYCVAYFPSSYVFPRERQKIYDLMTHGDSASHIPSFSDLGEKERWAITHYLFSRLEK